MDAFNLSTVVYHNSPSCAEWPVTSVIEDLSWRNRTITLKHSKTGQWPPVPFVDVLQEATLWVFFLIDGVWHGAGAERFRPAQTTKELGSPFDIVPGWLYDPNRWQEMSRHTLREGEVVGFCVTSGDMRSGMNPGPRERSAVVLREVRSHGFVPVSVSDPTPVPPPVPPPSPVPPASPSTCQCGAVLEELKVMREMLEDLYTRPEPGYVGRVNYPNVMLWPEE